MLFARWLHSISFFRKQLMAVIGINILSLAVASGLLYSSFVDDYRDNLVDAMHSQIILLASTSSSSLLFDDQYTASTLLNSLQKNPAIRFAQIFTTDKVLFAEYVRQGQTVDIDIGSLTPGPLFSHNYIYFFETIEFNQELLGYVLISTDTDSLHQQERRYARIVGLVFLLSISLAYLLNWRMQKLLTAPISQLVRLVSYVAKEGKYHKRLTIERSDEMGELLKGVNSMLDTIEQHEQKLKDNSERLESLVELRTEQLFNRANFDGLTNLPNRHLLTDRLSHGIEKARRDNTKLALMFLDLNRFKIINDSLGHFIGDKLLAVVATKLTEAIRKSDSVSRWGGDEFVILIEHIEDIAIIEDIAKNVVKTLNVPMAVDNHELHVSASIGIAIFPADGTDSSTLLKHADMCMYKAKEQGLGQYCFFHEDMLNQSVQRLQIENQLRKALEEQAFHLVYQPQLSGSTGRISGMEALIRWKNGDELISPVVFLPVVEEMGLMHKITQWVMLEACMQNRRWQQAGLVPLRVAVNMPVSSLLHPQCVEHIQDVLDATGLDPQFLEIEITESSFISSTEKAIEVLGQLQKLKISIAIDDFGTGYSSMSYLRDLPVNILKIDGSFVLGLGDSQASNGIVQSIITLGKSLNLQLIAECVENKQQADILAQMQCDHSQGYYYSHPLSVEEMTGFLASHSDSNNERN